MIPAWFDVGVLTFVALGLLALAVWRARFIAEPRGSRRVALILFMVPTLAFGWAVAVEFRHQWAQRQATAVTRALTGNPDATSVCQRYAPDLFDLQQTRGHVMGDQPDVAHLRRSTCNDFFSWVVSDKHDPTPAQVTAVHVVVHEAMHVAGEYVEAVAECTAMQRDAEAARLLGATADEAQALAEAYYAIEYPRMRDAYRSGDCTADGALDLSPGDGTFP